MSQPTTRELRNRRVFDTARKAQGFRDQAHLDAFYAYYDHTKSGCTDCRPGTPMLLDDGSQPTTRECDAAHELFLAGR